MDDLQQWLPTILQNTSPDTNINSRIFAFICPQVGPRFKSIFTRIEIVRNYKPKGKASYKAARKGKQSSLLGKLFELLIKEIFLHCQAFTYHSNVRTTISEIDCLLAIQPIGKLVPFIQQATTSHMIGEAKFYKDSLKVEWVNELAGILSTHNSNLGILFVGCERTTIRSEFRTALALHAQKNCFIVPFGKTQINKVMSGANLLEILSEQFVLSSAHSSALTV